MTVWLTRMACKPRGHALVWGLAVEHDCLADRMAGQPRGGQTLVWQGWTSESTLGSVYRVFLKLAANFRIKKLHNIVPVSPRLVLSSSLP